MNRLPALFAAVFLSLPLPAAADATALSTELRHAMTTPGMQLRMEVRVRDASRHLRMPFKVAIVARFDAAHRQVRVQGISPQSVRGSARYLELSGTTLRAWDEQGRATDPAQRLFDSGLVAADLLQPWWDWPDAAQLGTAERNGHPCSRLRLRSAAGEQVETCVDAKSGLAWETLILNRDGSARRTLTVLRTMRRENGLLAPKSIEIREADGTLTQLLVYSGDEQYPVDDHTFTPVAQKESP